MKILTKTNFIGIAVVLICCITFFGCSGSHENQEQSAEQASKQEQKTEQVSPEEQVKIDKVNKITSNSLGLLSLMGGEANCTSVKGDVAVIKMESSADKYVENISSMANRLGSAFGVDASDLDSDMLKERYKTNIESMKEKNSDETYLKKLTRQSTKDILTYMAEIKTVKYVSIIEGQEVVSYEQTEADVADVTASEIEFSLSEGTVENGNTN